MLRPGNPAAYEAALTFLLGRINYERAPAAEFGLDAVKLDRMRELLDRLGNPHAELRVAHVAGTKGKGSTAAMLAATLSAAGLRTGLYTSPHVHGIEERIAIDGAICTPDEFAALAQRVRPVVDEMDRRAGGDIIGPTYFEITTAMALLHFADRGVDAAVLEVGMGGRLDSTNVCRPQVCAITSISLDHTRQLGDTLEAIAGEKAGIIKPGVPVVSGVTQPEPRDVIRRIAAERSSPLIELGTDFDFNYHSPTADDEPSSLPWVEYRAAQGQAAPAEHYELGMWGRHQGANAAVAVALVEQLRQQGWDIPAAALRHGLRSARCPARIEVLHCRPTIVVDAAHNVASAAALVETLDELFPTGARRLIFAASQDKDAAGMLRLLLPRFDEVYLTQFSHNPRAVPVEQLRAWAGSPCAGRKLHVEPEAMRAWRTATNRLAADELLCVTGSFFLAAELRSAALEDFGGASASVR